MNPDTIITTETVDLDVQEIVEVSYSHFRNKIDIELLSYDVENDLFCHLDDYVSLSMKDAENLIARLQHYVAKMKD